VLIKHNELFPKDAPSPMLEFEFTYRDGKRLISDRQEINLAGYRESLFPWYGDPSYQVVQQLRNIADKIPQRREIFYGTRKACPYCGTMLMESAKKCHGCLEWLSGAPRRAPKFYAHARPRRR
jgi:hypothetical protein